MAMHKWGPSRLNHGTKQCQVCGCTYEEAFYALGMECHTTQTRSIEPPDPVQAEIVDLRAYREAKGKRHGAVQEE